MKNFLLVFVLLSTVVSNAQIVNIPDPNFKAALLEINGLDVNADGEIQVSEAEAASAIVVSDKNISDLTGIEAFVNISQLYVNFNDLTTIDISNNTNLIELLIEFNQLESLDVSNNPRLLWLWFSGNNVSEIDLSNNPDIQLLWASNNQLESLDVSLLPNLASLNVGNNLISTIDLTSNPKLSQIDFVAGNMFTELDLSRNPLLCSVVVGHNSLLEYINLKNGGNTLLVEGDTCYFGDGQGNSILIATNNPILSTICVDEVSFAESNFPHISSFTEFIDDCLLATTDFEIASVRLYPNPSQDFVSITSEKVITGVHIYSVLGRLMYKNSSAEGIEMIDISTYDSGIYFVSLEATEYKGAFQILKN